jgi:hypothetical protein
MTPKSLDRLWDIEKLFKGFRHICLLYGIFRDYFKGCIKFPRKYLKVIKSSYKKLHKV